MKRMNSEFLLISVSVDPLFIGLLLMSELSPTLSAVFGPAHVICTPLSLGLKQREADIRRAGATMHNELTDMQLFALTHKGSEAQFFFVFLNDSI